MISLKIIEGKDSWKSEIHTYQQNCVFFVNIACMFIMVTLMIVTRMTSQYYFVRTVDFFVCVIFPISGVFTTHSISLIFI